MLEQLRSSVGDDEDGLVLAPGEKVVDEIEEPGVSPLKIVEHQDGDAPQGDPLEKRAPRREQLVSSAWGWLGEPQEGEERALDPAPVCFISDIFHQCLRD